MIKIKGHSKYNVEVVLKSQHYQILKYSTKVSDNSRLIKQMDKQLYFYDNLKLDNFKIPKIIDTYYEEGNVYFLMNYIYYSENIIDFLEKNNVHRINNFILKLMDFIEHCINLCEYTKIGTCVIRNKIQDVVKNLKKNDNIDISNVNIDGALGYLNLNAEFISDQKLPMGICHGDLTLSNMLMDENTYNIYLIDFLDSFIESPIVDIVKIRQDTKFFWTLQLYNTYHDENKTKIILNYIDNKIDLYFSKYYFYKETYKFFETLNILRILQYATDKNIINYLLGCL